MAEGSIRVRRTEDEQLLEKLVPDHPHLTRPLADAEAKRYLVARLEGEPVGTCWVRHLAAGTGVFGGLFVEPDHRGKGIGGRLMDAGLAELAAWGARVGMLGVHLDNEEGLELARSRGFRTVGFVPGRSTGVGALAGDWVEKVSPLPFPDRSTRLMAVWLGDDRERHAPEPGEAAAIKSAADGSGEPPRARERPAAGSACPRT